MSDWSPKYALASIARLRWYVVGTGKSVGHSVILNHLKTNPNRSDYICPQKVGFQ